LADRLDHLREQSIIDGDLASSSASATDGNRPDLGWSTLSASPGNDSGNFIRDVPPNDLGNLLRHARGEVVDFLIKR
jgi:hypothetical protein